MLQPECVDGVVEESEETYYFKYLGGIQFTTRSKPLDAAGSSRLVVSATNYGLVIFSDMHGLYVARSRDLIQAASKDVGKESYQPPQASSVCLSALSNLPDVSSLALSADQLVLACVIQNNLAYFSVPQLSTGSHQTLQQHILDSSILQVQWCKDPQHADMYLVITDEHHLLTGRFPAAPQKVAEDVVTADWSPSGTFVAFCRGNVITVKDAQAWEDTVAELDVNHPDVPDAGQLYIESIYWQEPDSLLLGISQIEDTSEGDDAFVAHLVLPDWQPGAGGEPDTATLHTYTPLMIEADSTPVLSGPYLHSVAYPDWKVLITAHRKVMDEHVQLYQLSDEGAVQLLVTHDALRIALPSGPDGEDNYVLGLALDVTTDLGPLPHPLSTEKPELPACPTFIILTSDAVLRFFRFGHLDRDQSTLVPALPLPATTPTWATTAATPAAGGGALGGGAVPDLSMQPAAAAKVSLPDSDEEDADLDEAATSECGSTGGGGGGGGGDDQVLARSMAAEAAIRRADALTAAEHKRKAAATALPDDSDDLDDDEEEGSETNTRVSRGRPAAGGSGSDEDSEDEVTSSLAPSPVNAHKRQGSPQPVTSAKATTSPSAGFNFSTGGGSTITSGAATSSVNAPGGFGGFGGFGTTGFGTKNTSASSAPAFGSNTAPAFGATSTSGGAGATFGTPSFSFASTMAAFGSSSLAPPATSGGSIFGSGASTTLTPPATAGAPVFGAAAGTAGSSAAASSSSTGLFSAAAATLKPPAASTTTFGSGLSLTPPATNATSIFGTAGLTAPATGGGSIFGTSPSAVTTSGLNLNSLESADSGPIDQPGKRVARSEPTSSPAPTAATTTAPVASVFGTGGPATGFGTGGAGFGTGGAGFGTGGAGFGGSTAAAGGGGGGGGGGAAAGGGFSWSLLGQGTTPAAPTATDTFQPSPAFTGSKPGWVFTRGVLGQGYYKDTHTPRKDEKPKSDKRDEAATAAAAQPLPPQPAAPAEATADKQAPAIKKPAAVKPKPAAPPAPPAPPPVPAPKPQLADQSPEIAHMEADFLTSLHEVRKMSAEVQQLMQGLSSTDTSGGGLLGAAARQAYKPVSERVAALVLQSSELSKACDKSNQDVIKVAGELPDLERSVAALQLLKRDGTGPGQHMNNLAKHLPLEPALAALKSRISQQLQGISRCMTELNGHLDNLEWEGSARRGATGGPGLPQHQPVSSSVLYSTIKLQAETLANLKQRMAELQAEMLQLGIPVAGSSSTAPGGRTTFASPAARRLLAWTGRAAQPRDGGYVSDDGDDDYGGVASPGGASTPLGVGLAARFAAISTVGSPRSPLPLMATPGPGSRVSGQALGAHGAGGGGRVGTPGLSPLGGAKSPAGWREAARSSLLQAAGSTGKVRSTTTKRPIKSSPPPTPSQHPAELAEPPTARPPSPTPPQFISSTGSPTRVAAAPSTQQPAKPAAAAAATTKAPLPTQPGSFSFSFPAASPTPPAAADAGPSFSFAVQSSTGAATPPAAAATPSLSTKRSADGSQAAITQGASKTSAPKASQPPMPTMADLNAAKALQQAVIKQPAAPAVAAAASKPLSQGGSSTGTTGDARTRPADAEPTGSKPTKAKSSQPPMPSMDAMQAALAMGSQFANKTSSAKPAAAAATPAAPPTAAPKPKSSQPPIPSLADMQAAQNLQSKVLKTTAAAAPATTTPAASANTTTTAAAAPPASSAGFGFSMAGGATAAAATQSAAAASTAAAPMFNFSALSFGSTSPAGGSTQAGGFGGFGAFLSASSAASTTTAASSAATTPTTSAPAAASQSAPALFSAPAAASAPAPAGGLFGAAAGSPAAASSPGFSTGLFGSASTTSAFGAFGASAPAATTSPATSDALGGFSSSPAAATATGFGAFGASSPTPSTSTFGSFGATSPPAAATTASFGSFATTPATTTTPGGFGAFTGSAATTPAPATSTFGSFGAAAASSPAFGQPAAFGAAPAATGFGFASSPAAASAPAFGQPSAFGAASPASAPAATSGFGQPAAGFGQPAAGFGQPAGGFGQPAAGFGQPAAGFGQPAAGFGQPTAGFGQPAASGFGAGGFGSAPTPPAAGGGAFGSQLTAPAAGGGGFAAFSNQGGGFAALAGSSGAAPGGFGAFGAPAAGANTGFGAFGAPPSPNPSSGASNLWAPRK